MALTRKLNVITLPAATDLSSNQFMGLYVADDGQVDVNAAPTTATPFIGILMNKPDAENKAAEIAIVGSVVKMEAGAAIAERDMITGVTGGRGSATTTDNTFIVGYALTPASASAELFEVVVNPGRY
jgi:hypothetical protein